MEQGYFEADLAGNYILVNEASCRQLGYPKEELIGMNYRDIIASDDIENVYKNFNKVYRKGQPIRAAICKIVRKDGSTRVREFSVFPLRNNKGKIVGFRGVSRDITERMQMEEALRQSEERYRTILEEIQDAYFEVDLAGNFTFGNDSFHRYMGYSPGELIGINYQAVTAADDIEKVYKGFNQVYRTDKPINNLTYKTIRKDGSSGYVEIAVTLIRNKEENIIGFRGVGRDVAERMQMEQALRQSEERYRTVLDDMEEAYYEMAPAGNFTLFNDAMCRQLRYSKEEIMGMNYKVYV